MDFVADSLFNGRRIRALTVVDNFSRECLAIHVEQSIRGEHVVDIMEQLKLREQRVPLRIQVDNGSEFISQNARQMGLREPGDAGLLQTRKTHR